MKKVSLKLICGLFAAVFLLSGLSASAVSFDGAPAIETTAAAVYNLETGDLLFSQNATSRINPAAFTKLMTALLAYEYRAEKGNVKVAVTEEMLSSAGGTSMSLKVGENISFDDLLAGLVVQNANDAALVLASVVGGNISAFVDSMNEKAKELGMEQTSFSNPTGIDSAVMYTTVEDVLILCRALYRVNDFMLLSETPKVSIPATNLTSERVYTNKNALVPYSYVTDYYLPNARGMAAGFTPLAGYCVATVRESEGSKYLVVLSGGKDRSEAQNGTDISSYRDAKALLEWAEKSFAVREVVAKEAILCERKIRLASGVDHMILVAGESLEVLLPADADLEKDLKIKPVSEKEVLTAPVIKGKAYGKAEVYFREELIGEVSLAAQSNIGLSRWLVMWDAILGFFSQGPAKAVLILIVLGVILYISSLFYAVWSEYRKANKEKKKAIDDLMRIENQRMKKVRLEERKARQAGFRKVRGALKAGFQVLQGDAELMETPQTKKAPPRKAVAKVPEKYRKENRLPQNSSVRPNRPPLGERKAPPVPQKGREVYRVGRNSPPSSPKTAPQQQRNHRPIDRNGRK